MRTGADGDGVDVMRNFIQSGYLNRVIAAACMVAAFVMWADQREWHFLAFMALMNAQVARWM